MRRAHLAGLVLLLAVGVAAAPVLDAGGHGHGRTKVFGHSVRGKRLEVRRTGSRDAPAEVMVFGEIHGSETAGIPIVRKLREDRPPAPIELWTVTELNPDGAAAHTRQNAHGVDLNRNFPYRWRPQDGVYESGPGPASEPETQAIQRFVERIHPRVTLWYHQAMNLVVASAGDASLQRLYSRLSGLPRKRLTGDYYGTVSSWQNSTFLGDTAFVVELPAGPLPGAGVRRHANAVLALARAVAPPRITSKPIPYGADRKADMRGYALRHYGIDDYRLRRPRVIVEHYTVTDTFQPVYDTFAPNVPDIELHELPGICSHFVVDRDGTIYALVPTSIMCRHTVGLNYTAIGIEHVGRSDAQVLGNPRQMAASLRLTRMLQGRYGIRTRNVIGHNESLSSPFHRERVERLRTQTHADFPKAAMDVYRRRLERLPAPASLR
jgi:N-acetylmuramoyl-L-alanine amidase/Zinc carboxypeptidase